MVVEVEPVILNRAEAGNTQAQQRADIGFAVVGGLNEARAAGLKNLSGGTQQREVARGRGYVKAQRMSRAEVALNGGGVVGGFVLVRGRVGLPARDSEFLIHPRDYADGALRMQPELFD